MMMLKDMTENLQDHEKFLLIYNMYKKPMYYTAFKIVKNEFDAEDILQQSLLKVILNIRKFHMDELEENRTKYLLLTITRNTAIDYYRKNKKAPIEFIEFEELDFSLFTKTTEELMIEDDDYQNLISLIDSLKDIYREALQMKCIRHMTVREISEQLNISECNVNIRLSRARKALAVKLKNDRQD